MAYELTQEGLERLKTRLQEAEGKLTKLLRQKLETAQTAGDYWHDNPAFHQLEMEERALCDRIAEIREKLSRAVIVKKQEGNNTAEIGSFVELIFEDGTETKLTITDPEIADPSEGFISYDSPLGEAVLGARSGDVRTYSVEEREFQVKVVRIGGQDDEH